MWMKNQFIKYNLFCLVMIIVITGNVSAQIQPGKQQYNKYCLSCHGSGGKGDGELSYLLYPKPRDLTSGLFKIRSTQPGNPPTDDDLISSIKNGMPGTAMPSFNFLDIDELKDIVSYIKYLGDIENSNALQIEIPDLISETNELLELGKSVYTEIGCNKCHGDIGKGDGSSAHILIDSWGFPSIPRDFTSGVYLGGGTPQDLYLRFAGGMDGTPMPSYGNLSELLGKPKEDENELAWSLVYYVKSLEEDDTKDIGKIPPNGTITAQLVSDGIKLDKLLEPSSRLWNKTTSYSIPISRLWQSENVNYKMVEVQAIYNSKYIAIKLEWDDITSDQSLYRVQNFQDAAAIQFSIDGTMDFHGMGSREHPTDIWFWKSEWQIQQNQNIESDIELTYSNRVSDSDVEHYPDEINESAFLIGVNVGNINSKKNRNTSVENVVAAGPHTVTTNPENLQRVKGKGQWNGKKWEVVFLREIVAESDQEMQFNKNDIIPIGFAIWDGSKNDRNGQKMVSTWYKLELKD